MTRAKRAAPVAATRVGGATIAPAASGALVAAVAVAVGLAAVLAARAPAATTAWPGPVGGAHGGAASAPVGVAAGRVPDVPWLAERGDGVWLYGHGGVARALPANEFGLAIDERYLATATP